MFELLVGFFLLGSLSLAFRETGEEEWETRHTRPERPHPALPEDFDASVYEPTPMIEEEYLALRAVGEPEIFIVPSPERTAMLAQHGIHIQD